MPHTRRGRVASRMALAHRRRHGAGLARRLTDPIGWERRERALVRRDEAEPKFGHADAARSEKCVAARAQAAHRTAATGLAAACAVAVVACAVAVVACAVAAAA
eukprot:1917508-Prymnesium_polylepis.1